MKFRSSKTQPSAMFEWWVNQTEMHVVVYGWMRKMSWFFRLQRYTRSYTNGWICGLDDGFPTVRIIGSSNGVFFFRRSVVFGCSNSLFFQGSGFLRDTIYSWCSKSIIQRKNKKVHKGRCVLNLNWWWMMVIVVDKMISPKGYHDLTKIRGNKKTLHDAQHTASCTHVIGQVDSLARPSLGG